MLLHIYNHKMDIPENFQKIIMDMTDDFSETFPEYSNLWYKWTTKGFKEMDDSTKIKELSCLYEYMTPIYSERFFDIINQEEKIFDIQNKDNETINTFFLPLIDFKLLFNCNISKKTRDVMWNYLKLVLLTLVSSLNDKSKFGSTGNIFDKLNETELLEKLTETMNDMGDFFKGFDESKENENVSGDNKEYDFTKDTGAPKVDELFGHLKGLFDGKIGKLAKELAEEISGDLSGILGVDNVGDIRTTKDVIKKLLNNPSKIAALLQTVKDRLKDKISSGEVSQDELMKEAASLMSKMGDGKGDMNFNDLFKNLGSMGEGSGIEELLKNFGGGDNAVIGEMLKNMMGGFGKKSPSSEKKNSTEYDNIRKRVIMKRLKEEEAKLALQKKKEEAEKSYVPYDFGTAQGANKDNEKYDFDSNSNTFTIRGEECQEKSMASSAPNNGKKNKNNKKNKKNKK
jgi:hypothetical protein